MHVFKKKQTAAVDTLHIISATYNLAPEHKGSFCSVAFYSKMTCSEPCHWAFLWVILAAKDSLGPAL